MNLNVLYVYATTFSVWGLKPQQKISSYKSKYASVFHESHLCLL